jgi:predicted amidohydrolase YtcJ
MRTESVNDHRAFLTVADLVLTGGRIWTGNPQQPEAEAIAISGNRIVAVGFANDIAALVARRTRVIALNGKRVVPGFNDAHVHFSTGGLSLSSVNLRSARNEREMSEQIGRFARSHPKGEWILQGEWDPETWPSGRLPNAKLIDEVTPDHPVFVNRVDAHTMLANSFAMRLAGIDKDTPDVPFGVIERYADGTPTGIFIDNAQTLIARAIPPPSEEGFVVAIRAAQRHAAAHGVTSVADMGLIHGDAQTRASLLRAYQTLLRRGELHVRVLLHVPLPNWKVLADLGVTAGFGNEKLKIGALKSFSDGSLGSRTAWFHEAYADEPGNSGMCSTELQDVEAMYATLRSADRHGLQVAIHAIGDRANSAILDLVERLVREEGPRDRRVRIEHAQHLVPKDVARFAELGVIASVQPAHFLDDGRFLEERVGADRAKQAYAFRSLLDAGAHVAFGSDWWVAPIDPMVAIYAAVTRAPPQTLSVAQAVHCHTAAPAYASFDDAAKGSIEPGKLADIVVLSSDVFAIAPEDIRSVKTELTIFDGAVVYDRSMHAEPSPNLA